MRTLTTALAVVVLLLGIAAFTLFLVDASRLHGDALTGRVADGHYFVTDHGRETEVARGDWLWNRGLGVAALVGYPLGLLAGVFLIFTRLVPWRIYRGSEESIASRDAEVLASGAAAAFAKCGAKIDIVGLGRGMLRVWVHPGGLRLQPVFLRPFALARREIVAVRPVKRFLQAYVEVEHTSKDVPNPIRLLVPKDEVFAAALTSLAPR